MVRFLLGRSGTGKTETVLREIRARAEAGADGLLLLVPEFVSHAVERALIEHAGNRLASHAEVLTFQRLCERVALEAGAARARIDAGGRILLMYAACKQAQSSLRVLNYGLRPEFLTGLLAVADECRAARVSPETLRHAADGAREPLAGKLSDLAAILAAYQGVLGETRLDTADAISRLCEDTKKTGFFRGREIWIDGFSGFSTVEREFLSLVFAQAESVTLTLCADPEDDAPIFRRANETYARLKALCGRCHTDVLRTPQRTSDPALLCLERELFGHAAAPYPEATDAVSLHAAPTPYEECELAAAQIKTLVREHGYRYREIAVAARGFDTYAETLEAVFSYYEIPVYLNRKTNLLEKPVITLALAALDCVCDNFRYDDVMRYLKSGLCGLSRAGADLLETYLYTWNVHGRDWTDDAGFTRSPGGTSPRSDDEIVLLRLNRLRAKVATPLLALRQALRSDRTGAGFSRAMIDFFERLKLPRRLRARARLFRMRGELQLADEYRQLWEILLAATTSIGKTLSDVSLDLRELIRLFRLTVTQFQIGTIPVSLDRVSAGDVDRLGEPHPRALILLGCNDGVLPRAVSDTGLLSDLDRARLSALDVTLPQTRDRLSDDELAYAYRAVAYPSERLILTHSEGGESLPSFLFTRIAALLPQAAHTRWDDTVCAEGEAPALDAAMNGAFSFSDTAATYFAETDHAPLLAQATRNAALPRGPITDPDTRVALFGSDIRLSASRLDSFESCRYQYFLKYGLKLRPRSVAEFDPLTSGTFVHAILEQTLRELTARGGVDALSREETRALAEEFSDRYADERLGGLAQHTARFRALFLHLREVACRAVLDLYDELTLSAFRPIDFELSFSDTGGTLPAMRIEADGHTLLLQGVVDRVDGRMVDGTLYLRVLDYKTGAKEFSFDEVLNGIGMQLLLYLFALEDAGPARYGCPVAPAGVLYVPIREERVRCDLHPADALSSTAVRKGLLVNDPAILEAHRFLPVSYKKDGSLSANSQVAGLSTFYRLRERLHAILGTVGRELAAGKVDANPYFTRTKTVCTYCDYQAVCRFDPACGDRMRPLVAMTRKEFERGNSDA